MDVIHDHLTDITFTGNHTVNEGDTAVFMVVDNSNGTQPNSNNCRGVEDNVACCRGASLVDSRYGGKVGADHGVSVALPGGPDGTLAGTFVLCLGTTARPKQLVWQDVVFDGFVHPSMSVSPGVCGPTTNSGGFEKVAFTSPASISGLNSPIKGVRIKCASGTNWAMGFLGPDGPVTQSGYTTWSDIGSDYRPGQYGFHTQSGGNLCCGPTNTHVTMAYTRWDSDTVFEMRIQSDGKVHYIYIPSGGEGASGGEGITAGSDGVHFATSPTITSWPLSFGLSIDWADTYPGTCTDIQWLTEVNAEASSFVRRAMSAAVM